MNPPFSTTCLQSGAWWIGWVNEVPGVSAQEKTKAQLLNSLGKILREANAFADNPFMIDKLRAVAERLNFSFPLITTPTGLLGVSEPHYELD